jgi:hypothetical protein
VVYADTSPADDDSRSTNGDFRAADRYGTASNDYGHTTHRNDCPANRDSHSTADSNPDGDDGTLCDSSATVSDCRSPNGDSDTCYPDGHAADCHRTASHGDCYTTHCNHSFWSSLSCAALCG